MISVCAIVINHSISLCSYQSGAETTNWKALKETLPPRWVDKIENVEGDALKISKSSKCHRSWSGSTVISAAYI